MPNEKKIESGTPFEPLSPNHLQIVLVEDDESPTPRHSEKRWSLKVFAPGRTGGWTRDEALLVGAHLAKLVL